MKRRGIGRYLRHIVHDVRCLVKHYRMWKFDGQGANGKRWLCRICGRHWAYCWR
jgi:hypothetical protein